MSNNCIKLGKWYISYKYLFFVIISSLLKDVAFGSRKHINFKTLRILDSGNISNCFLVRECVCYLFSTIISFIIFKIQTKYLEQNNNNNEYSKNSKINDSIRELTGELELIHHERVIKVYPNKKLLTILFLWVLEEEFISYFNNIMLHLDFWMLELIIVHFFMKKMLKNEVYSHQKLMLWFCAFPFILKLITYILKFFDEYNHIKENNDKITKYKYSKYIEKFKIIYVAEYWLCPIGLVIYFILSIFRSYVDTKIKWLMDLKYISSIKIFFLFNLIGFIFCLLIIVIATFIPCNSEINEGITYNISDYFCQIHDNNKKKYLDNFIVYFNGLIENSDSYYEIIGLFLGVILFCFSNFFYLKVIELLSPVYIIFSFPIYYIFNKIYLLFLNFFDNGNDYLFKMNFAWPKLILDFSSDVVSILGYLIYLEIIELHFCKFDYDIRRNINRRGNIEVDKIDLDKSYKSSSNSSSDEQNSDKENDISFEY